MDKVRQNYLAAKGVDLVFAKVWADSLENYNQTSGRLKLEDSYCCLGVACQVLDANLWTKVPNEIGIFHWWWKGDNFYLPPELQLKLGLDREGQKMWPKDNLEWWYKDKSYNNLAKMNDEGHTFAQIKEVLYDYYGF